MSLHLRTPLLLLNVAITMVLAAPAEAGRLPFSAPPGSIVTDISRGKDYAAWTIYSPDYSANAVVARIKLPRQYWKSGPFRRYVKQSLEQSWRSFGIGFKAKWSRGVYVVSGTSGNYRIYARGRLAKGYWYQGWAVGPKGGKQTVALENMIKRLK